MKFYRLTASQVASTMAFHLLCNKGSFNNQYYALL